MKELSQLSMPEDRRYAESHEWAKKEDGLIIVGISDYAQDQLGDVVYVELPEVGSQVAFGDEFGTVESVKAVSELYSPLSGEVTEINEALADNPALVNESPSDDGWMLKIKPGDMADYDDLMDAAVYVAGLSGE